MTDYIVGKLPNRIIPLTKGCDARIALRRKDVTTKDPIDWGGAVYMLIDLPQKEFPERIDGVVDTSLATITIESDSADVCQNGTTWQVVLSVPGSPKSYERPLMVGTFERNDGK